MSHLINSGLVGKREELLTQIREVNNKIELLKTDKENVERDIRAECGLI